MLLGEDAENILLESKAAVFGVGGVGGHCVDALVRCGLGQGQAEQSEQADLCKKIHRRHEKS